MLKRNQIAELIKHRGQGNEGPGTFTHIMYDAKLNDIFAGFKHPRDGFILVCEFDGLDPRKEIRIRDAKNEYIISDWCDKLETMVNLP